MMIWDIGEEHKACYKNKIRLRQVNMLTDMFDEFLEHVFYLDRHEFFIDVIYTKEENVGDGIYKQMMKYLNMFVGRMYRKSFVDKYKDDRCVCRKIREGTIVDSLKSVFDCGVGSKRIFDDEKSISLIEELAGNLKAYIKTDVSEVYDIEEAPAVLGEFFPSIIFSYSCIRIGRFVFLILYGTTD